METHPILQLHGQDLKLCIEIFYSSSFNSQIIQHTIPKYLFKIHNSIYILTSVQCSRREVLLLSCRLRVLVRRTIQYFGVFTDT